ncbi:MFS family permease [Paenibacillus sp. DS2015]|uniref:MFS transporter n=1 Tax=Paenibacillus sp. DS2015 TaxID=3373917 RepID=UPI003D1CC538
MDSQISTVAVGQTQGAIKPMPTVWKNKQFLMLLFSYAISIFGNTFHSIALNLWVLQVTGSAKMMAVIVITNLVLSSLLGSIAGTYADRINRRKIMLTTDLISCGLVLIIGVLIYLPNTPFFLIVILTGLVTASSLFQSPAYHASLINVVGKEHIQKAVGLINISENICRTVGFSAGGIFVIAFGVSNAIFFDGITFLASFFLILFVGSLPTPSRTNQSNKEKKKFIEDLVTGVRFIWNDPFAKAVIILLPTLTLFFMPSLMLTQVMAIKVWNANPFQFGLMEACIPLGYMLGSGLIFYLGTKIKKRGKLIMVSLLLIGPMYILLSFTSTAYTAIPTILIIGFMFSFCTLLINIILRLEVSEELQGRVFGVLGSIMSVAPSVGLAIASYYADIFSSTSVMFSIGGLLLFFGVFAVIKLKVIKGYD